MLRPVWGMAIDAIGSEEGGGGGAGITGFEAVDSRGLDMEGQSVVGSKHCSNDHTCDLRGYNVIRHTEDNRLNDGACGGGIRSREIVWNQTEEVVVNCVKVFSVLIAVLESAICDLWECAISREAAGVEWIAGVGENFPVSLCGSVVCVERAGVVETVCGRAIPATSFDRESIGQVRRALVMTVDDFCVCELETRRGFDVLLASDVRHVAPVVGTIRNAGGVGGGIEDEVVGACAVDSEGEGVDAGGVRGVPCEVYFGRIKNVLEDNHDERRVTQVLRQTRQKTVDVAEVSQFSTSCHPEGLSGGNQMKEHFCSSQNAASSFERYENWYQLENNYQSAGDYALSNVRRRGCSLFRMQVELTTRDPSSQTT